VLRIGFEKIAEAPLGPLNSFIVDDAAFGSLTVAGFT
jgi:hypothetical protein